MEEPRNDAVLYGRICARLRQHAHARGVAWVEQTEEGAVRRLAAAPADLELSETEALALCGIIAGGGTDIGESTDGREGPACRVTLPLGDGALRGACVLWCEETRVDDPAFGEFLAPVRQALTRMAARRREHEERVHLEAALHAREERLRLALDATSEGVWDWDIVTGEVVGNEQWFRLFGYEPGEAPSMVSLWESTLHPDDAAETLAALNDYLEGRSPAYHSEHRVVTKSGEVRWHLSVG